ncbi:MAG TPA: thioesterase domain-containing protein [Myxococcaceae bacterium]|jgi:surfactin synthase thioesterase subunit
MPLIADGTRWLLKASNPGARQRLLCFPHAGGSPQLFESWSRAWPDVEVAVVVLPGRSHRFGEPCFQSVQEAASAALGALRGYVLERPCVVFGHSLGAFVAFEFLKRLGPAPGLHFVPSGAQAPPRAPRHEAGLHQLDDERLLQALSGLRGTPPEILARPDLMKALLPMLRSDVRMAETYVNEDPACLTCDLTAFVGLSDPVAPFEKCAGWQEFTQGQFALRAFDGDHFFLQSDEAALLDALRQCLDTLPATRS